MRPVAEAEPWRKIFAAVPLDAYRSPATEAMIEVLCTVSERFGALLRSPRPDPRLHSLS